MKHFFKVFLVVATLSFSSSLANALPTTPQGFVSDEAGVISEHNQQKLEALLQNFEKNSTIEIAIATTNNLAGDTIEGYAVKIFEKWGIGKKGKDNGILFLIAPKDRKVRFEIGYGLEGTVNDALAGKILDKAVMPAFRNGNLERGIISGTVTLVDFISKQKNINFKGDLNFQLSSKKTRTKTPIPWYLKLPLLLILIFLFIKHPWLFLYVLMSSGRGMRSSGGFSGGFGGFGGGLSGGGGSSRSW